MPIAAVRRQRWIRSATRVGPAHPRCQRLPVRTSATMSKSTIQRIDISERYSEAVIHSGPTVYLAGQVTSDDSLDAQGQTANILAQIDALLQRAGSNKDSILTATVYVSSMDHYSGMNAAWTQWVSEGHAPCRATVEAKLADPKWKVEIVCTAAVVL